MRPLANPSRREHVYKKAIVRNLPSRIAGRFFGSSAGFSPPSRLSHPSIHPQIPCTRLKKKGGMSKSSSWSYWCRLRVADASLTTAQLRWMSEFSQLKLTHSCTPRITGARSVQMMMKRAGFLLLALIGCGAAEVENVSAPTAATDTERGLLQNPDTEFSCNPCYVRCSNASPSACHWTSAYSIGHQANCSSAGDAWCANRGYVHSYAGCSPYSATYPACR